MGRRIFLDVGGHHGESVKIALNGLWAFDLVHTFEPDPAAADVIRRDFARSISDGSLRVHEIALGAQTGSVTLAGDNSGGAATTVAGFRRDSGRSITVMKMDVNEFLAHHIRGDDQVLVKMNCEGGEVEILDRLLECGDLSALRSLLVDFDIVRKRGGYFQKRRLIRDLRRRNLPLVLAEEIMVGRSHDERLTNWFSHFPDLFVGAAPPAPKRQPLKRRAKYFLRDLRSAVGLGTRGYS